MADQTSDASQKPFFTVSGYKLSVMYLFTLGLYAVYLFYKNWVLQRPAMDKKIYPVMRAIFSMFFTHSLFNRVKQVAIEHNVSTKLSYNLQATLFVALMVLGNVVGMFEEANTFGILSILSMLMFIIGLYPLYQVQKIINSINNDPHGVFNNEFSVVNIIFIVIGVITWFMIVIAALRYFGILEFQV